MEAMAKRFPCFDTLEALGVMDPASIAGREEESDYGECSPRRVLMLSVLRVMSGLRALCELQLQSGEVAMLAEHFGRSSDHGSFIDGKALVEEWVSFRDIMLRRKGVSVVSAQRAARRDAPKRGEFSVDYFPVSAAGELDKNRGL
jgi:hypothetical protein